MSATPYDHPLERVEPGSRTSVRARLAAIVAAAALAAGGLGFVVGHETASGSSSAAASAFGGPGALGGSPGGRLVQGTLTAKSASSLTVKTSSGTTVYTVTSSTQVVRDGETTTLSALQAGDAVAVRVDSSSSNVAQLVLAGTSARGRFGGPPGGAAPSGSRPSIGTTSLN